MKVEVSPGSAVGADIFPDGEEKPWSWSWTGRGGGPRASVKVDVDGAVASPVFPGRRPLARPPQPLADLEADVCSALAYLLPREGRDYAVRVSYDRSGPDPVPSVSLEPMTEIGSAWCGAVGGLLPRAVEYARSGYGYGGSGSAGPADVLAADSGADEMETGYGER